MRHTNTFEAANGLISSPNGIPVFQFWPKLVVRSQSEDSAKFCPQERKKIPPLCLWMTTGLLRYFRREDQAKGNDTGTYGMKMMVFHLRQQRYLNSTSLTTA